MIMFPSFRISSMVAVFSEISRVLAFIKDVKEYAVATVQMLFRNPVHRVVRAGRYFVFWTLNSCSKFFFVVYYYLFSLYLAIFFVFVFFYFVFFVYCLLFDFFSVTFVILCLFVFVCFIIVFFVFVCFLVNFDYFIF